MFQPDRPDQFMNAVFRVTRYAPDFAGLVGKDLTPQGTIETYAAASAPVSASIAPLSGNISRMRLGVVPKPCSSDW